MIKRIGLRFIVTNKEYDSIINLPCGCYKKDIDDINLRLDKLENKQIVPCHIEIDKIKLRLSLIDRNLTFINYHQNKDINLLQDDIVSIEKEIKQCKKEIEECKAELHSYKEKVLKFWFG